MIARPDPVFPTVFPTTKIEMLALPNIIPFVLDRGDGIADYGYAATQWVLDLLQWLFRSSPGTIPSKQKDRILGLLCGYSAEAIRSFEERGSGRLFATLTESDVPVSSSLPGDSCGTEEKSLLY